MRVLRALTILIAVSIPLVAFAAASPEEAVAELIASLKDAGSPAGQEPDGQAIASLLERLVPHLTGSSRSMVDSMLRATRAARQHDDVARQTFGAALAKEDGYMAASAALGSFIGFALPLAMLRRGSSAEILERSAGGGDAVYRVGWRAPAGAELERVEETLIVLKAADGAKLLVPGFGSVDFGSRTRNGVTENYVERQKRPWTAAAMRAENEATQRRIEGLAGMFDAMTADVKAGRFAGPKAYVQAIEARAQKM